MGNLVINAFAFKEGYQTSIQLGGKMDSSKVDCYIENMFVSLVTAKRKNPEDTMMLVTNGPIPEKYELDFFKNDIIVKIIPFDKFVMPKDFVWSLAFFKLCALSYVAEHEDYDCYLMIDGDTVTMSSYQDMWKEAAEGLLLFPVGHTYHHPDRERIRKDYCRLYGEDTGVNIVHYGGEFICGSREAVKRFLEVCGKVYQRMEETGFALDKKTGDETIISIAAALMEERVIDAVPYIYRYWTRKFYLISNNTIFNPVAIWHLPEEKEAGMRFLYQTITFRDYIPNVYGMAGLMGITIAKRPLNRYTWKDKIKTLLYDIRKKIHDKRNEPR